MLSRKFFIHTLTLFFVIFVCIADTHAQEKIRNNESTDKSRNQPDTTGALARMKQRSDNTVQNIKSYYEEKEGRLLFVLPFVSWNNYDNIFAGIGVFTNPVIQHDFEFRLFPSWSFSAERLNYSGRIAYKYHLPSGKGYVEPFAWTQSYSYGYMMGEKPSYSSVHGGVKARFGDAADTLSKGTEISAVWHRLGQEYMQWNTTDSIYELNGRQISLAQVSVKTHLFRFADVNVQNLSAEFNKDIFKISLTAQHSIQYNNPRKSFDLRIFAGGFVYATSYDTDYRFRLSGKTGRNDYLYENSYFGRSESGNSFLGNQMYPEDGYFKTVTPLGQTWDWIVAVNLRTAVPGIIPVQVYLDVATYKDAGSVVPGSATYPWNAGIVVSVWKDHMELYVPLLMSEDIMHTYDINDIGFFSRISWMVRFDKINPFRLFKNKTKAS